MWLLIPLFAVAVALGWTSWLARRERQRADEEWRARRMAQLGSVLTTTQVVDAAGGDSARAAGQTTREASVTISAVEVDLTDGEGEPDPGTVAQAGPKREELNSVSEIRVDE